MKKIILPTDFSNNAWNAIVYALHLYKDVPCTFYLLHVYTLPVYGPSYSMTPLSHSDLEDFHQERTEGHLNKLREELEEKYPNPLHKYKIKAVFGLLVDEIGELVRNEGVDVVIMGTKGSTGAKEILFGSNTVHAIKKANCPIMAIPEEFAFETPKQILFPSDYQVYFREKALKEVLFFAEEYLSCINVLHASSGYEPTDVEAKNKKQLERLLKPIAHIFHEVSSNEVISAINDFQLKYKVNLLVMVMNKHTFLENMFIKPTIRRISIHLNIPFMVIPYMNRDKS